MNIINGLFAFLTHFLSSKGPSLDGSFIGLMLVIKALAKRRLDEYPAARRRAVRYLEEFHRQIIAGHDKLRRMPKFVAMILRNRSVAHEFGAAARSIRNSSDAEPILVCEILAELSGRAGHYFMVDGWYLLALERSGGERNLRARATIPYTRKLPLYTCTASIVDFPNDCALAALKNKSATDEQIGDAVDVLLREPDRLVLEASINAGLQRAYFTAQDEFTAGDILALVLYKLNQPRSERARMTFELGPFTVEGALYHLFHRSSDSLPLESDESALSGTLLELPRMLLAEGARAVIHNLPPPVHDDLLDEIVESPGVEGIIASAYFATQRGEGALKTLAHNFLGNLEEQDWNDTIDGVVTILREVYELNESELWDLSKMAPRHRRAIS